MRNFGDYVVFVDESGDQSLIAIDHNYPIFVLTFCIFDKKHYSDYVIPEITRLKFKYWGNDTVIFHEREMRKRTGDFSNLMDAIVREAFFSELNKIMTEAEYKIVGTIIDKRTFELSGWERSPYDVATQFGMERVFLEMQSNLQKGMDVPIVFEGRGKKEDKALLSAIDKITSSTMLKGMQSMFTCKCISKLSNSIGLQFADMIARPIGTHYLKPDQENRAWNMLKQKMRTSSAGRVNGYGLKIYPQKYTFSRFVE